MFVFCIILFACNAAFCLLYVNELMYMLLLQGPDILVPFRTWILVEVMQQFVTI